MWGMNWIFKYHLYKRHTSVAEEVSRWPLSAEDWVWLQASSYGIYGGQIGTGLSPNTLYSFICHRRSIFWEIYCIVMKHVQGTSNTNIIEVLPW